MLATAVAALSFAAPPAARLSSRRAVATMRAARVAVVQPRVVNGRSTGVSVRAERRYRGLRLSGEEYPNLADKLQDGCAAQQAPWIESQTPIFSSIAWRVLHAQMLDRLDEELYRVTDWGVDICVCTGLIRIQGRASSCDLHAPLTIIPGPSP